MKKELEDSLRHMQSHPTTGEPHNQQVVSTQVETIFMLDGLKKEIIKLNKNIELSDKQSKRLEVSNYRLQWAMLILTFIATMISVYTLSNKWIALQLRAYSDLLIFVVNISISIMVAFIPFIAMRMLYGKQKFEHEMEKLEQMLLGSYNKK